MLAATKEVSGREDAQAKSELQENEDLLERMSLDDSSEHVNDTGDNM